jgi:hypothetical protein
VKPLFRRSGRNVYSDTDLWCSEVLPDGQHEDLSVLGSKRAKNVDDFLVLFTADHLRLWSFRRVISKRSNSHP